MKMQSRAGKVANQSVGQSEMYPGIVLGVSIKKSQHFSNSRAEKKS